SRGWIGSLEDSDNDLFSLNLGAEHDFESNRLSYDLFFSSNESLIRHDSELNMLMEPEHPPFIFEYHVDDPRGYVRVNEVNGVDPADLGLMTEGELEVVSGNKEDEVLSARIDWERNFTGAKSSFTFKTGAKTRVSSQFR